jgi:hypothetical protein
MRPWAIKPKRTTAGGAPKRPAAMRRGSPSGSLKKHFLKMADEYERKAAAALVESPA